MVNAKAPLKKYTKGGRLTSSVDITELLAFSHVYLNGLEFFKSTLKKELTCPYSMYNKKVVIIPTLIQATKIFQFK